MRASPPASPERMLSLWMRNTPARMTSTAPRLFRGTFLPHRGFRNTPATMVSCHRDTVSQDGPKSDAQVRGA